MKSARVNAGLSQVEMAEKMGVTKCAISYWENGKRNITAKDLDKYLEIVGATRDDIFLPYELSIS